MQGSGTDDAPLCPPQVSASAPSFMSQPRCHGKAAYTNLPSEAVLPAAWNHSASTDAERKALLNLIQSSVIGREEMVVGPFGERELTYVDYTASGRSLSFIEEFIATEVLPLYANTHTTASLTGYQTSMFYHEARMIIKRACNANFSKGPAKDKLLFVGSGVTEAINVMVHALGLKVPKASSASERPVVFYGPFEHHSNLLPWRESAADVVAIGADESGAIDMEDLRRQLVAYKDRPMRIGSFSACSNVTGQLADVDAITVLLHLHGALAMWDYASCGPYVPINMNPVVKAACKDAIFLSPHKFVGGPSSPGILLAKKRLFVNDQPHCPGGGTVFFVRNEDHRFQKSIELRFEGGTPNIVGAIRASLAFQLKTAVGPEWIHTHELQLRTHAIQRLAETANLVVFGAPGSPTSEPQPHLPILSFVIQCPLPMYTPERPLLLHHNYVAAVLDDLFGLQTRGGCLCAGPYAQRLLGMTPEYTAHVEDALLEHDNNEVLRPGVTRLNLPYWFPRDQVNAVLDAIAWTAENAWKLMPEYTFIPDTGEWFHRKNKHHVLSETRWLGAVEYKGGRMSYARVHRSSSQRLADMLPTYLKEAEAAVASAVHRYHKGFRAPRTSLRREELRWFALQHEVVSALTDTLDGSQPLTSLCAPLCPIPTVEIQAKGSSGATKRTPALTHVGPKWSLLDVPVQGARSMSDTPSDNSSGSGDDDSRASRASRFIDANLLTPQQKADRLTSGGNAVPPASTGKGEAGDGGEGDGAVCSLRPEDVFVSLANDIPVLGPICGLRPRHSQAKVTLDQVEAIKRTMGSIDWVVPPKKTIMRPMLRAVHVFQMIQPGDRVMVAVSGGKDSLSLLHAMKRLQARNRVKFDLAAMTVDPMTVSFDPSPLRVYMKALDVPYFYEAHPIIDVAKEKNPTSICSWCARMKRGMMYSTARREGYNVIAMGQHLDDLAESFIMSAFNNGRLRSMKANYVIDRGDLRVIRPFVYVREHHLRDFAGKAELPVISENCPACFEVPRERERVKTFLAAQEQELPLLFSRLSKTMDPLVRRDLPPDNPLKEYTVEELEAELARRRAASSKKEGSGA